MNGASEVKRLTAALLCATGDGLVRLAGHVFDWAYVLNPEEVIAPDDWAKLSARIWSGIGVPLDTVRVIETHERTGVQREREKPFKPPSFYGKFKGNKHG